MSNTKIINNQIVKSLSSTIISCFAAAAKLCKNNFDNISGFFLSWDKGLNKKKHELELVNRILAKGHVYQGIIYTRNLGKGLPKDKITGVVKRIYTDYFSYMILAVKSRGMASKLRVGSLAKFYLDRINLDLLKYHLVMLFKVKTTLFEVYLCGNFIAEHIRADYKRGTMCDELGLDTRILTRCDHPCLDVNYPGKIRKMPPVWVRNYGTVYCLN